MRPSADERVAPARHMAVSGFLGAGDDPRLRPGLAAVDAARKGLVLVGLGFGGALRPHRHERASGPSKTRKCSLPVSFTPASVTSGTKTTKSGLVMLSCEGMRALRSAGVAMKLGIFLRGGLLGKAGEGERRCCHRERCCRSACIHDFLLGLDERIDRPGFG